ncbi:MAG: hypothetical protein K2Q33_08910 [Gammaproteobacteria bacterium]|nr:hypothetical protein [Gammaproteobacteria bacterium]
MAVIIILNRKRKMEAAQPKPSELSQPERIKLLLQDQLGLTEEQAIGFAYSIGQQLYGYHKRLIGLGQEAGDDQDIPYTVKFSRVSEKIVAELHTETDPKLYSRFEIAVSELTNELGQPQQARVRLDSTISSNSPEGEWQEDGYHYRSAAKARLFWPSIEEKQAAVEKRQTVDAKEERTTTKQISSTDKTTLFEMIGPMLLLAKAFTLVKEVVSDFVKYMESQPNTNEASVPTPVASSSVIEKSTADSQNRYGMFAMIGAVGKMVMNAISLEAVNRSLGPKA